MFQCVKLQITDQTQNFITASVDADTLVKESAFQQPMSISGPVKKTWTLSARYLEKLASQKKAFDQSTATKNDVSVPVPVASDSAVVEHERRADHTTKG